MRPMIARPWVILLAAGAARRFGRPKQLARVSGESLLHRSARLALASRPAGCVVVLGARASRLRRELADLPVQVVVNRRWRLGQSTSIACGIAALPASARAATIVLADQAALEPVDLAVLAASWRCAPDATIAARANDVLGPPALFPKRVFRELRRLRGDRGARDLLRDPDRQVVGIDLPRAGIDVDRPQDARRAGRASPARSRAPGRPRKRRG